MKQVKNRFQKSNLRVVNYSIPVDKVTLTELNEHLHSLPNQPNSLPYITSYFEPRWGFTIAHNERIKLSEGLYSVKIDSNLKPGSLTYGEILIPGDTSEEIFISTYICHPSLANNELSGPVLATYLSKWILSQKRNTATDDFVPETIGALLI